MAGDFIPHQDGAFLEWAKTLLAYVSPKLAAFNIPAGALPPIQAQLTAYEAAQSPNRGKVDVLTKNEAKEALYICPRWENGKGDKGPWGEIYKAIVP
jgi:hypothetical protein